MSRLPFLRLSIIVAAVLVAPFSAQADMLRAGGSSGGIGTLDRLLKEYARREPGVGHRVVPDLSSGGGIKAVTAGVIDIGISSRPLSAQEEMAATQFKLGATAFVFATDATASVDALTTVELVGIYAGHTLTWRDGRRLRLLLSPAGDSNNDLVGSLSPALASAVADAQRRPRDDLRAD